MSRIPESAAYDENGTYAPWQMSHNIFFSRYGWECIKNLPKKDRKSITDQESNTHTLVITGIGSDGHLAPKSLVEKAQQQGSVHFARTVSRKILNCIPVLKNTDSEATAKLVATQVIKILDDALEKKSETETAEIVLNIEAHSLGADIAKKVCLLITNHDTEHNTNYLRHIKKLTSHAGANGPIVLQQGPLKSPLGKLCFGIKAIANFEKENIENQQAAFDELGIEQEYIVYNHDRVLKDTTQCPPNHSPIPRAGGHFGIYED